MIKEIFESLTELGLSNRESICYTSLLELGSSSIGIICKKTEIPSSKIYEILDKLIKKGLVTYVVIGNVKHYQASNPKILLNLIDEKKKNLENVMPQLLLKQKFSTKQNVEMFNGQKALFSLFTGIISDAKQKEEYLIFSIDEENKNSNINLFFRNITVRRKEKKLDVKILKNMKYYKKEKHTKLQLRYTKFNLPQGITLFRDMVILVSWDDSEQTEPIAIKITSTQFANQLKTFFKELWSEAKI